MPHPSEAPAKSVLITADKDFAVTVAAAFKSAPAGAGQLVGRSPARLRDSLADLDCALIICDLDGFDGGPVPALADLILCAGPDTRIIAVTGQFDSDMARGFLRLKVNDFLVKPVTAADLARTITRVLGGGAGATDAQVFAFFPCAGGVGNTTLALQSALLLNKEAASQRKTTCLVDLNLQQGACAEYLDLEPRFDIAEIETQPDRLDRQLLDMMLSRHKSGLAIVSAPPCPWEMRSYRPDLITRLLDLVSTHFDIVIVDMPRTWFPWTDTVLMGSDRVFLVTEMTVPALRHTQRLAGAMRERIGSGGQFGVLVNRADTRPAGSQLRVSDVEEVLGDLFLGTVANDYRAVREALDQGRPLEEVAPESRVLADLKAVLFADAEPRSAAWTAQLKSVLARLGRRKPAEVPAIAGGRRHA